MADFTNIPTGLNVPSQIPLNIKEYVLNEAELSNLGTANNKAFTYHDQMKVVCIEEKKEYLWREPVLNEQNTGLLDEDFTYPMDTPPTFGIDYAGRSFNFFEVLPEAIDLNILNVGPGAKLYVDNELFVDESKKIRTLTKTGDLIKITEKPEEVELSIDEEALIALIPPAGDCINLQKKITEDYTLTDADDKYTIFVENGLDKVFITIPLGLKPNFFCVFLQQGPGEVMFTNDMGVTVLTPIGYYIKGQYYWAHLEKVENQEVYHLLATVNPIE